jgi:hypothetical protein
MGLGAGKNILLLRNHLVKIDCYEKGKRNLAFSQSSIGKEWHFRNDVLLPGSPHSQG